MNKVIETILSLNKKNKYIAASGYITLFWSLFSFLSIFLIPFTYLSDYFVISSIIIKISTATIIMYFFYNFFILESISNSLYKKFQTFTGYGIVITYVFYSFPRIVAEFYDRNANIVYIVLDFAIILFISLLPFILYIILRLDQTKLAMKTYKQEDIDYEKKLKKDKVFRKKEQKKIRGNRTLIQNIWYDWVDVILQAILIVMIINQVLFQMYAIPSESMVPTFLKKDMVIVNKLIYGPQIPLTEWKIFSPFKPKSGDIVVFLNPETYDKESDVSYKNIFARIFQPFLYRLTFTKVDIDLKEDGSPKERFIVKRMIAKEKEKICIVDNKVYKKKKNTSWTLMSNIKNEKEWGNVDLYFSNTQGMDNQRITTEIRDILTNAQNIFKLSNDEIITNEIENIKSKLSQKKINKTEINNLIERYSNRNQSLIEDIKDRLFSSYSILTDKRYLNQVGYKINDIQSSYVQSLDDYKYVVLQRSLEVIKSEINKEQFQNNIISEIKRNDDDSPYERQMKTVNAVYKQNICELLLLLSEGSFESLIKSNALLNLYYVSIYTDGLEIPKSFSNSKKPQYYSFFELSNLSEFPLEKESYIKDDNYLVLGDNRYNSLDSRFHKTISHSIKLDNQDSGIFSKSVTVAWNVGTIEDKFILGKALAIYFPFKRMRLFL